MLVLESTVFKGSLLDLIGKNKTEVLGLYAQPVVLNEGGRAERLVWTERARDEETGRRIALGFMARLLDGVVWAVGIQAETYFSVIEHNAQGAPYFVAVPKGPEHDRLMVNWVAKNAEGAYYDFGVSH